jgi:predicted GTPase
MLIKKHGVDIVVFSYSDIAHVNVMHKASQVLAAGADWWILGPKSSLIKSRKKVISICASRTGAGKSQTTRRVCEILRKLGLRYSVVRHPMPYGDLREQIVQKFSTLKDLDRHKCTIEEREEYEPHIRSGSTVFAGVDYGAILKEAEKISDVVLWDGGNNDMPFYAPDLNIVVVDPFRVGHESTYFPGEPNVRMAEIVVINKVDTASRKDVETLAANVRALNPKAEIIKAASPTYTDRPELIKGKKVVVIEDGPTLTHGEMSFGAGIVAARKYRCRKIVDPRPYAVGSIKKAYEKFPQMGDLIPALGYSPIQIRELEKSINNTPADTIVMGTPIDLRKIMKLNKPAVKISYVLKEIGPQKLERAVKRVVLKGKK